RSDLERELNTWIRQYVADQENPPADVRSRNTGIFHTRSGSASPARPA
ncbi:type VI secretion system contractile sheath large subunit, partial [Escherichia coli]|nr:type VI secretion system contractile sheath large subunit [Escherichia coli]